MRRKQRLCDSWPRYFKRVIAELNISSQLCHCNFKITSMANSQTDQNLLVWRSEPQLGKSLCFSVVAVCALLPDEPRRDGHH